MPQDVSGEETKGPQNVKRTTFADLSVTDNYTLSNPSSAIHFNTRSDLVVQTGQSQIILEKGQDNVITARQIDEESTGYDLLRGAYTIVAFLFSGFLFVFCTQLILFLFLGLAIETGLTTLDNEFSFISFVGTLFAIPVYMIAMTNAMTIAMAFTQDTWNGHKFMKTIFKWDSVIIDWISTAVFVFVPFFSAAVGLYAGSEEWWEYTLITWFSCVFVYFLAFSGCTIYHEIDGCLQLVRYSKHNAKMIEKFKRDGNSKFSLPVIKAAIMMKMKSKFSGTEVARYIVEDSNYVPKPFLDKDEIKSFDNDAKFRKGLFSKVTDLIAASKVGMYTHCTDDKNNKAGILQHEIDLVRGYTPFVTKSTWGLEKLYCRNRDTRYIAFVQGESALNKSQIVSSLVCFLVGLFIQLFLFIAFMVWMELPAGAIGVICGLYALWNFTSVYTSAGLYSVYKAIDGKKNKKTSDPKVIYQVCDDYRITEPAARLCWIILALECLCLFWFPLGVLIQSGNYPVAFLFLGTSIVTFFRRYLSSTVAVREFGSLDGIETDNETGDADEEYREKHRLGKIIAEISSGRRNDFWMSVFGFFILVFCGIFMAAVWKGSDSGSGEISSYTSEFEYPGSGNLEYSSCSVGGEITPPSNAETSLADIVFLATVAYEAPEITNITLNEWFDLGDENSETAQDLQYIVDDFKTSYEKENGASAVTYKLIKFPKSDVGVITIRGTSNGWDALADAQLWSSASIAQWLRALVPVGNIFTPVLEYLVEVVSWIQADSLAEVAFYKQTTAFVEYVNEQNLFGSIIVTGHSLGGGLAMISGAQSQVPAVALSGPNAVISRRTFSPPVSIQNLERYTFNIVPDRDVVPRLDDLSQNYQRIKCRSGLNDPLSCHFGRRSMCEVLLQCGSKGRPIPCHCITDLEDIYADSVTALSDDVTDIRSVCSAKN